MIPYKASKLPVEYKIDKEMLRLISEANEKYGEYKSLLNTLEFDSSYFLDSRIQINSSDTYITVTEIKKENLTEEEYEELSKNVNNLDDLNNDTVVGLIVATFVSDEDHVIVFPSDASIGSHDTFNVLVWSIGKEAHFGSSILIV